MRRTKGSTRDRAGVEKVMDLAFLQSAREKSELHKRSRGCPKTFLKTLECHDTWRAQKNSFLQPHHRLSHFSLLSNIILILIEYISLVIHYTKYTIWMTLETLDENNHISILVLSVTIVTFVRHISKQFHSHLIFTVMLSEVSQTEKEKYCMVSFICGILK